ncbi:DUF3306 domain-containing protein [Paracoccus sp. NSM]|uniref:DUF3306 domain-containing protein n=1 Tax=Paracoccus sp. NSM TaxID=3457784 RepID=UPI004035DC56
MTDEDDGFLSRWSRRKRKARAAPEPQPEPQPEAQPEAAPVEPETLSDEELAALPRIEDLTEGSDIRAFLRAGVPAALKNAALRRVWMLTPAIRDYRDPAVDYAWDWNTPGGVPGDGCAPAPERAAQMLRDLLDPPKPQAEALPETEPADETTIAEASPKVAAAPEDRAPSRQDASAPPAFSDDDAPAPQPPRRHGGALPT